MVASLGPPGGEILAGIAVALVVAFRSASKTEELFVDTTIKAMIEDASWQRCILRAFIAIVVTMIKPASVVLRTAGAITFHRDSVVAPKIRVTWIVVVIIVIPEPAIVTENVCSTLLILT